MEQFKNEIKKSVENFEKKTGAEIVVILAERSNNYYKPLIFPAPIAVSFLTWMMYTTIVFSVFTITITVALILMVPLFLLLLIPKMRLLFYSKKQISSFIESSAHEYFSRKTVYETSDRCGILLYYSRLEKEVKVIPDKGIKMLVSTSETPDLFSKFEHSIRKSGPGAIPALMTEIAQALGDIYPWDPANENELSDEPDIKKD